ncbi:60S ribosomal protein L13a, partial [Bienertia sinuspersici]
THKKAKGIFGVPFTHFDTLAEIYAKDKANGDVTKEREKRMEEKVNKVLEEVMKLDGISPFETLEVATILMAEEHKLRIIYQAQINMKNNMPLIF